MSFYASHCSSTDFNNCDLELLASGCTELYNTDRLTNRRGSWKSILGDEILLKLTFWKNRLWVGCRSNLISFSVLIFEVEAVCTPK